MDWICKYMDCTGCQACQDACMHGAITMTADEEGFLRPYIDQEKCIDCGLCAKTCPANIIPEKRHPIEAYSGWIKDNRIRMESSSGGAFSALALPILERGGVVFGAQMDKDMCVSHTFIDSPQDLQKLRGSKYVQSNTSGCFRQVRNMLKDGKEVLFSGTPCQVAALRNFLRRDYDSLITVDVVCHGVPSPQIFNEWKEWFKDKYRLESFETLKFRGKKKSWIFYNSQITGKDISGKDFVYTGKYNKDEWIQGFLSDKFLRPSCHTCFYAGIDRASDFTISDWWGYKGTKDEPNDYERKGVSLILCNTPKAVAYLKENVKENMYIRKRDVSEASKTSGPLTKPFPIPESRNEFWTDYKKLPFNEVVRKHMRGKNLMLRELILINMKPSKLRNIVFDIYFKSLKAKKLLFSRLIRSKDS